MPKKDNTKKTSKVSKISNQVKVINPPSNKTEFIDLTKKMTNYFSFEIKKGKNKNQTIIPFSHWSGYRGNKLPPTVDKAFLLYQTELCTNATNLEKTNRYKDLRFMYYNNAFINAAIETYANEAVMFDENYEYLYVEAVDKNVKQYIENFLKNVNINAKTSKEYIFNMALYGDAFALNNINYFNAKALGITELIPQDVFNIKKRLEFNVNTILANKQKSNYGFSFINSNNKDYFNTIIDSFLNIENYELASYYKPYLFGFSLSDDTFLPPWLITHFRLDTSENEFYPYGKSLVIGCLSPFRQELALKNIYTSGLIAKQPKEIYKIKTSEFNTQGDNLEAVMEIAEQLENLSNNNQTIRENITPNSRIYIPKDMIDFEYVEGKERLIDRDELLFFRDETIAPTGIPKNWLFSDNGDLNDKSGKALKELSKPFYRGKIYPLQTAFMLGLTNMIKIHFLITGVFPVDTEFRLYMNTPILEEDEKIDKRKNTLDLASSIINNLKEYLGVEEIPVKVIKRILSRYTFLSTIEIDDWVKQIEQEKKKNEEMQGTDAVSNDDEEFNFNEQFKNILDYNDKDLLDSLYIKARKESTLQEGVINNKHYLSSFNKLDINSNVNLLYLESFLKNNKRKL